MYYRLANDKSVLIMHPNFSIKQRSIILITLKLQIVSRKETFKEYALS